MAVYIQGQMTLTESQIILISTRDSGIDKGDIANTMSDRNSSRGIRSCSEHPDRKGRMMMTIGTQIITGA